MPLILERYKRLSKAPNIIFGTMRLAEHSFSTDELISFFLNLYDNGIHVLHVSSEYDGYDTFCDVMRLFSERYPHKKFKYMVKLGEPHFSDDSFDKVRFFEKVNLYLEQLGTDQLDSIQWMWRQGLKDDPSRIESFLSSENEINDAFRLCKAAGKCRQILCFPYSVEFALKAIEYSEIDGLAVYLNPEETEYLSAIQKAATYGKTSTTIRPFGGDKKLVQTHSVNELIDFSLARSGISKTVLTATKVAHLQKIIDYCNA